VLLSASAGLMVRSLLALTSVDPGFDPDGVLRADISLPGASYQKDAEVWALYDRIVERAAALPGVTSAAAMSGLPPLRRANNTTFMLDGAEMIDHDHIPQVDYIQHLTAGYLDVMRIALVAGRNVTVADNEWSAPVVLVNETLARRFWPGEHAVGHRLRPAMAGSPWFTVVGVTRDTRQGGLQAPAGSEVLVPFRQSRLLLSGWMPRDMNLVVRMARGAPGAIAPALRTNLRALEPAAAVSGVRPLHELVDDTVSQPRLLAWLLSSFAVVALAIAGVGVYGVTAYHVGCRTPEFGVRMALGATPTDVFRHVLKSAAAPVAAGLAAGVLSSIASGRLLAGLVFGVLPTDPLALAAGTAAIGTAAAAATLLPALRAARLDPLTALRDS
jgi:putative ABC transport system permease protein